MNALNVDMDVVNLLSTNIKDVAEELKSFSHSLNIDDRSTISANSKGQETFAEMLEVTRMLGEALNNSADQIVTISEGFAGVDSSFAAQFNNNS